MHPDTKTLTRAAVLAVLLLVVLPFVVAGVPAVVGAEHSYIVTSGSMAAEPEPVLRPGDVIIVDSVDPQAISAGDIVTFERGDGQPITHRVVDVTRQDGTLRFTTKGDNNEDADPAPVRPSQVVGLVVFTIPLIGHVVRFANTPLGFAALVGAPIALLVLSEAWSLAKHTETDTDTDTETRDESTQSVDAHADDTDPTMVSLDRSTLRAALVLLIPVDLATGLLAARLQTAWALTLCYATLGLTLLTAAIYVRLNRGDHPIDDAETDTFGPDPDLARTRTPPAAPDDRLPGEWVVTGHIVDDLEAANRIRVDVDEIDVLVDLARDRRTRVVEDRDDGAFYLVTPAVVYRYDPGAHVHAGEASTRLAGTDSMTLADFRDAADAARSNGNGTPPADAPATRVTEGADEPTAGGAR